MQSSDLTVTCRGCGSALTLDGRASLVPGFRPFVAVHRACAGGDEPDREMRTAFARRA